MSGNHYDRNDIHKTNDTICHMCKGGYKIKSRTDKFYDGLCDSHKSAIEYDIAESEASAVRNENMRKEAEKNGTYPYHRYYVTMVKGVYTDNEIGETYTESELDIDEEGNLYYLGSHPDLYNSYT